MPIGELREGGEGPVHTRLICVRSYTKQAWMVTHRARELFGVFESLVNTSASKRHGKLKPITSERCHAKVRVTAWCLKNGAIRS